MAVKRKYDAPGRREAAAQTRERVCAAAEAHFLRDGYARTSIRAVAKAAGVAEATVYLAFPNKPALLNAVILRAVGDNASEPLDVIAAAPPAEILPRLATSNAALMVRAGALIALGEAASLMDTELRPWRDRAHTNLRAAFRVIAGALDAAGLLRVSAAEAADTLYALASESTYLRRSEAAGPGDYARWLERVLTAALT
ncbi:TetR/AcrR family transcriptional regulator [Solirubrobacter ginsenosidimutans]|uniref:TetR/AcrR family transcriptional regulator n=1 Tax=Solirubrobacter ginsenosidimutans TaxID=490573 RepID=A0A9X3MNY9_9ACTN|nr:TetR/AcrR family transcriptional regulator [Solirubrobacter ginsenosidimutans]MDA0160116.1 TetR/AcrR family transcriptional regulator [Solirubrobacter ginsenosidimutans]